MTEGTSKPWEDEPEDGSFGQWLRRQREIREIGLREIAETSKISIRYLEALEQDRFDLLPAPVFAKGFLREYSKFVGLDPDEVVNYFLSALPEEQRDEERKETASPSQRNFVGPLLIVLALLLAAAGAFSYLSYRGDRAPREMPPMAPPVAGNPVIDPLPVETAEQVAPIRLTLDFNQNSWVEVRVDGERQVSELRVQGESLRIDAENEIRVILGNAAGVGFELNGKPLEAPREDGEELVLDLETVRRLESGEN